MYSQSDAWGSPRICILIEHTNALVASWRPEKEYLWFDSMCVDTYISTRLVTHMSKLQERFSSRSGTAPLTSDAFRRSWASSSPQMLGGGPPKPAEEDAKSEASEWELRERNEREREEERRLELRSWMVRVSTLPLHALFHDLCRRGGGGGAASPWLCFDFFPL